MNEYNNTYHRTAKMKSVDVKDNTYINFGREVNEKDPRFQVEDCVRIPKYKNSFEKGYTPNWSEEVFVIKTWKTRYHVNILNGEEIIGTFYEKQLQKSNQEKFRIK